MTLEGLIIPKCTMSNFMPVHVPVHENVEIVKCMHVYSIQFINQLRALKGQQENCTYMNKQYEQ